MPTIQHLLRIKKGFTLIEVLSVVAILTILMIALLVSVAGQRDKAEDARVKSDLERLRIAFEDYYNDNNCYPPPEWFDDATDCGSNHLSPYLNAMPCDKETRVPYKLFYVPTQCSGFQLYGELQNTSDPAYSQYIDGSNGVVGNYGVSSSNVTVDSPGNSVIIDNGSGEGDGDSHYYYWCSSGPSQPGQAGNCTSYEHSAFSCNPSFIDDPNCGSPSESGRCQSAGSCTPL